MCLTLGKYSVVLRPIQPQDSILPLAPISLCSHYKFTVVCSFRLPRFIKDGVYFWLFLYSIFLITLKWFQRQESEAIKNTVISKLEVLHRSKFFSIRFTVTSQFSRPYDICIFSPTNAKHMLCNSSQTPANSNSQGI